jgi:tetratricopeptide (TPR) repeat protein
MQESAAAFNQLIAAGVHLADASYGLGLIRLAAGDLDGAAGQLAVALRQNPRHVNALYVLGTVAERRNAWDAARMYYTQALAIDPQAQAARERLAQLAAVQVPRTPQHAMRPVVGVAPTVRTRRTGLWRSVVAYIFGTAVLAVILTILNAIASNAADTFSAGLFFYGVGGFMVLAWFVGGIRLIRALIQGAPSR